MSSVSANDVHIHQFWQWCPAAALQGALKILHFFSQLLTFGISKVRLIHWPWKSLLGFVKQNTSPFVSQRPERRERSKDKAMEQAETWRSVCGVKLKLFDSQFSYANNPHNLILPPHFNFHCLEKNVPFYLLSVLYPIAWDTANKQELQSTLFSCFLKTTSFVQNRP